MGHGAGGPVNTAQNVEGQPTVRRRPSSRKPRSSGPVPEAQKFHFSLLSLSPKCPQFHPTPTPLSTALPGSEDRAIAQGSWLRFDWIFNLDPAAGQAGRVTWSPGVTGLQPEVGGSEARGRLRPSLCSGLLWAKEAAWTSGFSFPNGAFHSPAPDFCETWRWAPGEGPCADLQQINRLKSRNAAAKPRQTPL